MNRYRSSEKTRQALIDAAGELAAEYGLNAVTTRAIADRAGENLGSIHYHFGGKEKLYLAVVHQIAERWLAIPIRDLVVTEGNPSRRELAEMVRRVVRRNVSLIFDPDAPDWHCRVIYQLMQRSSPLLETIREIILTPETDQAIVLMKMIDPSFDDDTAMLHYVMMISPLLFHNDYRDAVLLRLNIENYDEGYVGKLEELCIRQSLLLLNLPLDERGEE